MKKAVWILFLLVVLCTPARAEEITAPTVPDRVEELMPQEDGFAEGLLHMLRTAITALRPDISEACITCMSVIGAVILLSVLRTYEGGSKAAVELCGVIVISAVLLGPTNSLIALSAETVTDLSEYSKLLIPVMTAAMAAQGGAVTSAAIYTATAFFSAVLSTAIAKFLVPMVYIYLVVSVVNSAAGDDMMKKLKDFFKWMITWGLKICLYVFTGYISITGVISGATDQAALKATKLTISGMVPVIGGILSDASETVLISAGIVKNAAGVYGVFAILALTIGPFLRIGLHYLLLKLTGAIGGIFSDKKVIGVIEDFSGAMGLLLAMTGSLCLMLLIGIVCFMKGVG